MKIFADGANIDSIKTLLRDPIVEGFTTNPTLMRQAGVVNYLEFARNVIDLIDGKPLSLEVFSDDLSEMASQARKISRLGQNVYVKIPVTTTQGEPTAPIVRTLSGEGVKVNVTAVFTVQQIENVASSLNNSPGSFVSVFAGRIADAGIDPIPTIVRAREILSVECPTSQVIWASPREVLNIIQARECKCHVITVTPDLLAKYRNVGKDLEQFSRETVQMFYNDAQAAGYSF